MEIRSYHAGVHGRPGIPVAGFGVQVKPIDYLAGVVARGGFGDGNRSTDRIGSDYWAVDERASENFSTASKMDAPGHNLIRIGGSECGEFLFGTGDHIASQPL
jgi:hypothetical protein